MSLCKITGYDCFYASGERCCDGNQPIPQDSSVVCGQSMRVRPPYLCEADRARVVASQSRSRASRRLSGSGPYQSNLTAWPSAAPRFSQELAVTTSPLHSQERAALFITDPS